MNMNTLQKYDFTLSGNILQFRTPGGRPSGFESPPHPTESTEFSLETASRVDPSVRKFEDADGSTYRSADAAGASHALGVKIAAVRANAGLSEAGKREQIDAAATTALAEVGAVHNDLAELGTKIEAQRVALYAPPKLTPEAAPVDVELRTHFRSLDGTEKLRTLETLTHPGMANMLDALLRSPLPLDEQTKYFVSDAHEKRIAAQRPAELQRFKVASENHDWSMRFTGTIANLIARAAWPTGDSRGYNQQLAWNALRGIKATSLLGLDRHTEIALEQRAQRQGQAS